MKYFSGILFLFLIISCVDPYVYEQLEFSDSVDSEIRFYYSDTAHNSYLRMLRMDYDLKTEVGRSKTDFLPTLRLMHWTHGKWKHHNFNAPSKGDAMTILEEAESGTDFRCVEYATVLKESLESVGITARTLVLKTQDASTKKSGAGHVLAEVYIRELNKWILADAQFNLIPILNGIPLNAIELQEALFEKKEGLRFQNVKGLLSMKQQKKYLNFISPYLYYFLTNFDHRAGLNPYEHKHINGNFKIMLVPQDTEELTVFQRDNPIENCFYTNSKSLFYSPVK